MSERDELSSLDMAIQHQPDAAVNYLRRGEFWLRLQNYPLAYADLTQALALAQTELANSDWGYILQSYIDRAENLLAYLETIKE